MDISKFKNIFIDEVEDHLQKLNDNLLAVEVLIKERESGNPIDEKKFRELLDELMRSSHTIKSSAATMGYHKMSFLTHVLEDVFDYARNGLLNIKKSVVCDLFEAIDAIDQSLKNIREENKEGDLDIYSSKIKKITGVATDGIGVSKRSPDGIPIVNKDNKVEVDAIVKQEGVSDKVVDYLKNDHVVDKILHIKVPIKRLDDLMNLTEELLIEKMRLNTLMDLSAEDVLSFEKKNLISKLKPSIDHLNSLVSNLQYLIMQSRLVPAGQILARFPRMIRDMSSQLGKEIDLVIKGEDLEMDRSIIDKLGEPLVHLLRNAVDHGIDKEGNILIEVKRDKDFASIIVQNDGRSIDWIKLVESAVTRGIITTDKGNDFLSLIKNNSQASWQAVIEKELLYNPRLSTNDTVTETSGRGVGTSVVKKFAEEMGGDIIVMSPVDENGGTRFVLNLPLTLAIIKALLVEIGGLVFAIPFSSVERAIFLNNEDIKSVVDQDMCVVGDIDVPLISLENIFHLIESEVLGNKKKNNNQSVAKKIAVLVKKGEDTAGFLVDKLLSEQEIIVKPLPSVLKGIKGFSGSTILGDGNTVLILDIASFLQGTNKNNKI
jgi:two-component system chemotaxis sensor kinase CheA